MGRQVGMTVVALAISAVVFLPSRVVRAQQANQSSTTASQETSEAMLTYSRGQPVLPVYEGWHPNPDGTIDLWFGYLNQNYKGEPTLPVGPENSVVPPQYGPDAGQPTHFLPRNTRWVFSVRVPKDFGDKEVV